MFLIYSVMRVVYVCGYKTIQSLKVILFPVLLYWAGSEFLKYWLYWSVTDRFWQNNKTVVVAKTLRVLKIVVIFSSITLSLSQWWFLPHPISFQIYYTKKYGGLSNTVDMIRVDRVNCPVDFCIWLRGLKKFSGLSCWQGTPCKVSWVVRVEKVLPVKNGRTCRTF